MPRTLTKDAAHTSIKVMAAKMKPKYFSIRFIAQKGKVSSGNGTKVGLNWMRVTPIMM
jgi:hypothetical protein